MGEAREGDWDCAGCENRNYAFRSFCNRCKLPRRGEGKEGDWECGGCHNRNYAFRSFCNRCKQPRLLVDTKTPTDSKWLPRIGDWICSGCSNNNYASREKCKKCGQPKEEAAMPAMSMRGASLPAHAPYFSRGQDLPGLKMYGMGGNPALQQLLQPNSGWSFGGAPKYGLQSTPNWPFNGTGSTGFSQNTNPLGVPKGWRSGDWLCNCGFHNYSSRTQCKECNAPLPSGAPSSAVNSAAPDIYPTLGTKRLASEEFVNDWDHKRLNTRDINNHFLTTGQQQSFLGFEQLAGSSNGLLPGVYSRYPTGNSTNVTSMQGNVQSPHLTMPALIGKGAKQWRDGDWMCSNCDNHNYASRSSCNRCKTPKEAAAEVGTVV